MKFCRELRAKAEARNIADQLSAAATAIAANYRCVTRARSRREFIAKLAVAVEEADETIGWLDIVLRTGLASKEAANDLLREARELTAILSASRRTAEKNSKGHRD